MDIDELIKRKDEQLEAYLVKIKDSRIDKNRKKSCALYDEFGTFLCDSAREFSNLRGKLESSGAMTDNPFVGNLSRYLAEKGESYGKLYRTLSQLQEDGSVPTDIDLRGL